MYLRVIKAINEGIDKALMSFDDDRLFDKSSKIENKTAEYIVYNEMSKQKMKAFDDASYQWFLDLYLTNGFQYEVYDRDELQKLVDTCINKAGDTCNLNWINVGHLDSLNSIFYYSNFNGDISEWDVHNVKDMRSLFANCQFNGNISEWDVHNVKDMAYMFYKSQFNQDISKWDVSNVTNMEAMFSYGNFNGNISDWDTSQVNKMIFMFKYSDFNLDISSWNVYNVKYHGSIFYGCDIKDEYKPKFI